jgi:hypothetical protein
MTIIATAGDVMLEYILKLPASFQSEALDYVEYLLGKAEREPIRHEEKMWSGLSLISAMWGMEDEDGPSYITTDLKVIFG